MARSAREGRVVTGGIPISPTTPPDGQPTQYFGSDQTALIGAGVGAGGNTAEQPTGAMMQEGEKSGVTPWLITAAVVAVMVIIGLLIWWNYTSGRTAQIEDPSPTPSTAETSEEAPSTEAETSADEDDDNDSNWEPSTEEETSETPSETPSETISESPSESDSPEPTDPEPTDPTTTPADTTTTTPEAGGGGGGGGDV
jgi:serine/threonine-protein kinase